MERKSASLHGGLAFLWGEVKGRVLDLDELELYKLLSNETILLFDTAAGG